MAAEQSSVIAWIKRRRWELLIACAVLVGGATIGIAKTLQSSSGCQMAVQAAPLPPALSADGILGQPITHPNDGSLQALAKSALIVEYPDIASPVAQQVVTEAPLSPGQPIVEVVPFRSAGVSLSVVGVVAFAKTCAGQAVFDGMQNWQVGADQRIPRVGVYPSTPASVAAAELGTKNPALVYVASPFTPEWEGSHHNFLTAVPGPS